MPELMNVGPGHDYSINDYYRAVAEVVGYAGSFVHDLTKPVGMMQKVISTGRLSKWGWQSKESLHDGLVATYDFYLQHCKNLN